VGFHNKYLLGSLEGNIITVKALAKTKFSWGAAGGARVRARGGSCPLPPPLATPMVASSACFTELKKTYSTPAQYIPDEA